MKLRIVEGGAGSGKSRLCIDEIAAELQKSPLGAPLLLLVPEQSTFLTECALVAHPDVGATFRAEVLGFLGLYRWLGAEYDYPNLPALDEQGRSMLLLACVQDNIEKLQILKSSAKNPGFMDLLARTLVEFEQYNIEPEQLEAAALGPLAEDEMLAAKLSDLAVIYRAYLARVVGGFRDRAAMMNEIRAAAKASERMVGAKVWIDGFMDMNPSQLAVMREIFAKAEVVTVSLNLPDLGAAGIFAGQRRLRADFMQLAKEIGADIEVVRLTENHRHKDNPELSALEVCFAAGQFAEFSPKVPKSVHLLRAENRVEEAELAAELVAKLCWENNLEFRDIAVITRKIDDYRVPLENAFRDFDIPYFFDMGRDVSHHPLVKLIAEILAVFYDNWATPSVLAYLKSGLADISEDEADVLENYALRVGLRGTMWLQAGCFKRGDAAELESINEIAQRGLRPLLYLAEKLKNAATVGEFAKEMTEFLRTVSAEEKMQLWAKEAMLCGETVLAEGHKQIYERVQLLLGELADFLADMPADARRFAEFWQEGAARLTLSSIPPSANRLSVADVSRSRLGEVKAAIVLGLAEGSFPSAAEDGGLLQSFDKERLAAVGLNLPPGGRERQFMEDYLIYVALTRSSEQLYLLYPEAGADGASKNPSPALADVRRIFPSIEIEEIEPQYTLGGDRALLKGLSKHLVAVKAGEIVDPAADDFWRGVIYRLRESGKLGSELALLAAGLSYSVDVKPLDPARLAALYPNRDFTSVSRLERFNNCPCQYFAQYGLGLAPRDEFKLRTLDIGNLYHYVLAEVIAALVAKDCDWATLGEDEILLLIDEAMRSFAEGGLADILADSGKNAYAAEKMRTVLKVTILDMAKNLAAGAFRPTALELSFGRRGDGGVEPMYITLENGRKIKLVGQIDRIDTASGTSGEYLRIIDYKMSDKTLKLSDIYYGLNWQMPLYLKALLESRKNSGETKLKPAGMFYVPVQEIVKSVKAANEAGATVKLQGLAVLDMEALSLAERDLIDGGYAKTMQVHIKKDSTFGVSTLGLSPKEYDFVQACLEQDAVSSLQKMLGGAVEQRPVQKGDRLACEFCDFYPLCAVDLAVSPRPREVEKLSTAAALKKYCEKYPDIAEKFGMGQGEAAE